MEETVFTKIIKGEIPCHKIYEDDRTIAFLDIHPINSGHVLVVPKKQIDHLWDLSTDDYDHLWSVVRKVALKLRTSIDPPRVGVLVEGFAIAHCHIHVIPFYHGNDVKKHQDLDAEPNHEELSKVAKILTIE